MSKNWKVNISHILIFLTAIGLEIYASLLAFDTHSEILSKLFILLTALIGAITVVLFLRSSKIAAFVLGCSFFFFLVPSQLYYSEMRADLLREASDICSYAYQHKVDHGNYPNDLDGYEFADPELKDRISYDLRDTYGFTVDFYVWTATTSHSYLSSSGGKWWYYPD